MSQTPPSPLEQRRLARQQRYATHLPARKPATQRLRFSQLKRQVWAAIGVVFFIWLAIMSVRFFRIMKLTCLVGETEPCPAEIVTNLNQLQGRPLWLVRSKKMLITLPQQFPQIETLTIEKTWPNQLHVQLTLTRDLYVLKSPTQQFTVNSTGTLRPVTELSSELPQILLTSDLPLESEHTALPAELHADFLFLFEGLKTAQLPPTQILWTSAYHIQLTHLGKTLIVKLPQLHDQLATFALLDDYPVETAWETVDLRFDRPILKTATESAQARE